MKDKRYILFLTILIVSQCGKSFAIHSNEGDSLTSLYEKGLREVNYCTPWHHLKCVMITGTEVYEDGRDGKKVRHWWRMSYIGRACKERYGKVFGIIFEGLFVVPHYTGVAVGSGFGYLVYAARGPRDPEKVLARKKKRENRKEQRKLK